MSGNMQNFSFCAWFISLNILMSNFIHVVANERISLFLWLNGITLCVYHIFFILSCTYEQLSWFHILAILTNAQLTWKWRCAFQILISFPLDIRLIVGVLDHIAVLSIIFWETSILFSIMVVLIYISKNNMQMLPFLHILTSTCYFSYTFWSLQKMETLLLREQGPNFWVTHFRGCSPLEVLSIQANVTSLG
jgi:hypothetical protein